MKKQIIFLFAVIFLFFSISPTQAQSDSQNSTADDSSSSIKKKPLPNEMDTPIKHRFIFGISGGYAFNSEKDYEFAGVSGIGLVTRYFGIETAIELNPGDDSQITYESYTRISFSGVWFLGGLSPGDSATPYLKSGLVWQEIFESVNETTRAGLTLSVGGGFKIRISQFSLGFETLYILPTLGGSNESSIPGSFNISITVGFHVSSALWALLAPIAFF